MNRSKLPVKSPSSLPCTFRIIGGDWRSRKFQFPNVEGIRPTPDRVRETLFNWLSPFLTEARCLDLFCGSGALGLEALSRGAEHCTFIDANTQALTAIQQHLQTLACNNGHILQGQLPDALLRIQPAFSIVFIDPPYALNSIIPCLNLLIERHLLVDDAIIYIECSSLTPLPTWPEHFSLYRHKTAGQVQYALLRYNNNAFL